MISSNRVKTNMFHNLWSILVKSMAQWIEKQRKRSTIYSLKETQVDLRRHKMHRNYETFSGAIGTVEYCCWECKMVQPLWKIVYFYKTKHDFTIQSSNHAPWYLSKGVEILPPHKNSHIDVFSICMHNSPNLEEPKCPSIVE